MDKLKIKIKTYLLQELCRLARKLCEIATGNGSPIANKTNNRLWLYNWKRRSGYYIPTVPKNFYG